MTNRERAVLFLQGYSMYPEQDLVKLLDDTEERGRRAGIAECLSELRTRYGGLTAIIAADFLERKRSR